VLRYNFALESARCNLTHRLFCVVLSQSLRANYRNALVEWVDCPNLCSKFNLVAPGEKEIASLRLRYVQKKISLYLAGLCGNTAILEVGSLSNLFPRLRFNKIYHFDSIIEQLKRTNRHNFIIGAGKHAESGFYDVGEVCNIPLIFNPQDI